MSGTATAGRAVHVGFLFNHDATHQVAHAAPIAYALARRHPDARVTLLASSPAHIEAARQCADPADRDLCEELLLGLPWWQRTLARGVDAVASASRYLTLRANLETFRRLDALVVPEKTSLLLRRRFGLDHLKLIHTRHGAGDRPRGFNAKSGAFDLLLLPGRKYRDRLRARGVLPDDRYVLIGYPKFDTIRGRELPSGRTFFGNDKPVVLYNPHFAPEQSSWYRMGRAVLEFFRRRRDYNLICAPHVMLFKRRLHIARRTLRPGFARRPPARYQACDNILIDTGSPACTDMTYTLAADLYLGDVSSQVYEFLLEPRPCLFLDAHAAGRRQEPHGLETRLGPVTSDTAHLGEALAHARASHAAYRPAQEAMFDYTFDLQETPSSVRAAEAVAAFLRGEIARPAAAPPFAAAGE